MFKMFLHALRVLSAALEEAVFVLHCCSAAARANLAGGARSNAGRLDGDTLAALQMGEPVASR